MTYVPRESMSMNSSGGLQQLADVCQLKNRIQNMWNVQNFLDNPYNLKHVFFLSLSLSLSRLKESLNCNVWVKILL